MSLCTAFYAKAKLSYVVLSCQLNNDRENDELQKRLNV